MHLSETPVSRMQYMKISIFKAINDKNKLTNKILTQIHGLFTPYEYSVAMFTIFLQVMATSQLAFLVNLLAIHIQIYMHA